MKKSVVIGPKPRVVDAEAWVNERRIPKAKKATRRISVDVDRELHRRILIACAREDLVMADEVRRLIEERFGERRGEGNP